MHATSLLAKLHQLRRRARLVGAVRRGLVWAFWGGWMGAALGLAMKVADRPTNEILAVLWAPALFGAGGLAREALHPRRLLAVALEADRRADTKERLSTALEWLESGRPPTAVSQFMIVDAAEHAETIDPGHTFPLRVHRPLARTVLPLLAVLVLVATPSWGLWRGRSAEEVHAVRLASEHIQALAQRVPQRVSGPVAKKLARQLHDLSRQLREGKLDRQEAASRIRSAARQLAQDRAGHPSPGGQSNPQQSVSRQLADLSKQLAAQSQTAAAARAQAARLASQLAPGGVAEALAKEAMQAMDQGRTQEAAQKMAQAAEAAAGEEQAGERALGEMQQDLEGESASLDPSGTRPGQGEGQLGVAANPSSGQSGKSGKKGQADFGVGTTNQEEKNTGGKAGGPHHLDRQSSHTSAWEEEYKQVYTPERIHRDAGSTQVHGQLTGGRVLRTTGEVIGAPRQGGSARIAPADVYLSSKQAAEQAVARGNIPSEYRDAVRSYFDRIDPRVAK